MVTVWYSSKYSTVVIYKSRVNSNQLPFWSWSYKQILSVNLRALSLVEILEQPTKMLKNKRVVDLHWKILYRTGPGVVNWYHKLLKYKIGNRLDCEILEISRCRRRLRLRPHRPLPSLPTSLQGSEEAEGGSVLLLRLQGHGGSLEMHQKVCHLPTYVFIAISSNIQPLCSMLLFLNDIDGLCGWMSE